MKTTKAEKEFDGDCFGEYWNGESIHCQICTVAIQCAAKTLDHEIKTPISEIKETRQRLPRYLPPVDNKTRATEDGFYVGSASHIAYCLIREQKSFVFNVMFSQYRLLLEEYGIKLADSEKMFRRVLSLMEERNKLRKLSNDSYEVLING